MQLPCIWNAPRPYVHPLTSPAGAVLSVEAPGDHPWHHALWFTVKFVNGENFWEEYGEFGVLRARETDDHPDGSSATIDWVAPDGESVRLVEQRSLTTGMLDSSAYVIDWIEELSVPVETVLDRTPFTTWGGYGGLTLRGAPDWTDTTIRLDDGVERDRCLGERSRWLSITGTAPVGPPDGLTGQVGVAFFDHPDNERSPSPWYASTRADTYGDGWANFVNAAFLWDEPLTVMPDAPLRLRYRVLVHDGGRTHEELAAAWTEWAR